MYMIYHTWKKNVRSNKIYNILKKKMLQNNGNIINIFYV